MSYILDALQRSSQDELTDSPPGQPQSSHTGLALPWKIAIGAVLATNILFLYLWQTGESDKDSSKTATRSTERPVVSSGASQQSGQIELTRPQNQEYYLPRPASPNTRKKILPGIASPRELPPPRAQTQGQDQIASLEQTTQPLPGTARTFRPNGAPITIADPPTPGSTSEPLSARAIAAQALAETEPQSTRPEAEPEPESLPDTQQRPEAALDDVSQLHELSDSQQRCCRKWPELSVA